MESVKNALSSYGEIKSVRHQMWPGKPSVSTGCRLVRMVVKKEIPRFISIGGIRCKVWYRDQPLRCDICRQVGHAAKQCPDKGKCRRCHKAGHFARECTSAWNLPQAPPVAPGAPVGSTGGEEGAGDDGGDIDEGDAAEAAGDIECEDAVDGDSEAEPLVGEAASQVSGMELGTPVLDSSGQLVQAQIPVVPPASGDPVADGIAASTQASVSGAPLFEDEAYATQAVQMLSVAANSFVRQLADSAPQEVELAEYLANASANTDLSPRTGSESNVSNCKGNSEAPNDEQTRGADASGKTPSGSTENNDRELVSSNEVNGGTDSAPNSISVVNVNHGSATDNLSSKGETASVVPAKVNSKEDKNAKKGSTSGKGTSKNNVSSLALADELSEMDTAPAMATRKRPASDAGSESTPQDPDPEPPATSALSRRKKLAKPSAAALGKAGKRSSGGKKKT